MPGITKWLIILPILDRLYTSVNLRNPEIWALKESWSTDLSPRHFTAGPTPRVHRTACTARPAGVYPGWGGVPGVWGYGWVAGWAIPVPVPDLIPGPIFNLILR